MLKVDNLSKVFNIHILGDKLIEGCDGVIFNVDKGEFLGLAGPSGAGKSTILKCIYRTYLATSGDIRYDSILYGQVNLATIADHMVIDIRHKEIGYVSQFLKVIPRVSAIDVVAEPLLTRNGASAKEARKKAGELLERLNIPARLLDAYPATFSGGEQQRVNIARAVIWKPRLLLLDEPTASLDRDSVSIVVQLLREMREQGTSMIGIFHDNELMESITDRVYRVNPEINDVG
ncbi:MAG: phosphonate C-P lyase system protein PhnL [Desulfobacteraceae bacterium A6]|nr:MAG: phosphonate C-P lyase system protein PhnL [Desulfobacteraceae bacterium A6]